MTSVLDVLLDTVSIRNQQSIRLPPKRGLVSITISCLYYQVAGLQAAIVWKLQVVLSNSHHLITCGDIRCLTIPFNTLAILYAHVRIVRSRLSSVANMVERLEPLIYMSYIYLLSMKIAFV